MKIHVVGAGPAGSIAAISALRKGHDVVMSEEHPCAGLPENCSGLFSKDGLESLSGFFDYRKSLLNNILGADIYFAGVKLRVRRKEPVGFVCSRPVLDSTLAANAESEGAVINYGERVKSDYHSNTIIGADGPSSSVAMNFKMGRISNYAATLQATVPFCADEPHIVEVFLSSEAFPGLFGWLIPQNEETAEIGVGVAMPTNPLAAWEKLLKMKGVPSTRPRGWSIPLDARPKTGIRSGKYNVLLAGDAAGQVKATTGGGVIFGGSCAALAGTHASNPQRYELEWRLRYGTDLAIHKAVSSHLSSLSDEGLRALGRKLNRMNCGQFLSNHGHMDKPTKMVGPGMITHVLKNIAGVS
jgi:digeranylgeranylglycerophospholipid reductase